MPLLIHSPRASTIRRCSFAALMAASVGSTTLAGNPYASNVAFYDGGTGPVGSYTNPNSAVGSPERFTGEGIFPQVVSMFNPAWGDDEMVGITGTGSLVLQFDTPITNNPTNPFGADLIIFGNGGWIDQAWPNGVIDSFGGTFGLDQMRVSVSQNGVDFVPLGDFWEGMFPAQGYQDVDHYSGIPGSLPADFTKPVDPALTEADFGGLTFAQALALYNGSGGGTPIDIAASGFASVNYVKVELTPGGINDGRLEIDGMSVVPEPGTLAGLSAIAVLALRRRSRE